MSKKYIAAGRKFGTPAVALSLLIGGIATRSQAQAPDATAHASPSTGRQSTKEGGQILLQHSGTESRRARASPTAIRETAYRPQGNRRGAERVRISIQPISDLARGIG